jgi:uncharacterized protein YndB with AHSA1/START domain
MSERLLSPLPRPGSDRELLLTRVLPAPPARAFNVWTTRLPEWWGPHGMTTPVCEMNLRPGGIFRTVMRAPDGTEYSTRGVFLEVVAPARIVFTDAFEPGWIPTRDAFFTAITTFEEFSGQTARALHWSVASRERHERMGFHAGWGESLDRLAALLTRLG